MVFPLSSSSGNHAAIQAVLAVVVFTPGINVTVLADSHAVVGTGGDVDNLSVLNLLRDGHNVLGWVSGGVKVMAPYIHLPISVYADGKGSTGGDIHSIRLHAFGQLHQAVGGGDIGVHWLAACLVQVSWGDSGAYKREQEQTRQQDNRAGGKGLTEKALDRQLAGTVIPVVLHG